MAKPSRNLPKINPWTRFLTKAVVVLPTDATSLPLHLYVTLPALQEFMKRRSDDAHLNTAHIRSHAHGFMCLNSRCFSLRVRGVYFSDTFMDMVFRVFAVNRISTNTLSSNVRRLVGSTRRRILSLGDGRQLDIQLNGRFQSVYVYVKLMHWCG